LEISRSGQAALAWVFFAGRVPARDARRLGTAIITHTCARTRQLKLESYDRLFPNQDTMPKGGFGNLIALPLQKGPREKGFSVFVDASLRPHPDQWAFLASIQPMAAHDSEPTILRATGGVHPLDVSFAGSLRPDQEADVAAMLPFDAGVLCAPTAFGKAVTAAASDLRRWVSGGGKVLLGLIILREAEVAWLLRSP